MSNRLNHQVAPPDLAADGYSYMGGRLAATPDGPAGLFMYDDPQGVRLTVFVLPLNAAASMPIQHVDFAHVDGCAWIDKSVGYTVVGKLPPAELRRIAELVRLQLSGADRHPSRLIQIKADAAAAAQHSLQQGGRRHGKTRSPFGSPSPTASTHASSSRMRTTSCARSARSTRRPPICAPATSAPTGPVARSRAAPAPIMRSASGTICMRWRRRSSSGWSANSQRRVGP